MTEHLSKALPGWSAETKASIEKYAENQGYPALVLQNMGALDYQIAWKAMQYDKLKADAKAVVKTATTPVIKPSARKEMPKAVQNKLNYRKAIQKAPDVRTRSKLAEDRLGEIFGA